MRARHRLSKLLLRQGIVYFGGTPWTDAHELWLRRLHFDDIHLRAAFDHGFDAVLAATAARDRLDEQIAVLAASPRFADPANRLGCLRGTRLTAPQSERDDLPDAFAVGEVVHRRVDLVQCDR